jgi:hypothetical protein
MTVRICLILSCLFPALVNGSFSSEDSISSRQGAADILSKRIEQFDSTKTRMADQLIELASALKIPMGIETSYVPEEKSSSEIHLKGVSGQDVLREILRQNPGYSWEITQNVVHVFNNSLVYDVKNYLNILLPQYRMQNEDLLGASEWLHSCIRMYLYQERIRSGEQGHGPQPPGWDVWNLSLDLHDVTVREILNKLVLMNGNSLWISCIDQTKTIDRGTYFAQRRYLSAGPQPVKDFHWDLIPLEKVPTSSNNNSAE